MLLCNIIYLIFLIFLFFYFFLQKYACHIVKVLHFSVTVQLKLLLPFRHHIHLIEDKMWKID